MSTDTDIHTQICEAAVARIQAQDLDYIDDANVVVRGLDEDNNICFPGPPGVMVLGIGLEIPGTRGENIVEEIGYPLGVVISDDLVDPNDVEEQRKHHRWRHQIRGALWHKPTELKSAGAPSQVWEVEYRGGPVFLPRFRTLRQMWVGTMAFIVWSYEGRPSG